MSDCNSPVVETGDLDNVIDIPTAAESLVELLMRAPAGRLSDAQAAQIMSSSDWAQRSLEAAWEESPPGTRVLADILLNGREGMLRLIRELHLQTGTVTAKRTALRIAELQSMDKERLEWLSGSGHSEVASFSPTGDRILSQLDVECDEMDAYPPSRVWARVVDDRPGGAEVEVTTLGRGLDEPTYVVVVYQAAPQLNSTIDYEPQLLYASPILKDHGTSSLSSRQGLQIPDTRPAEIGMLRVFSASAK